MINAAIFDLDGVLIDSEPLWKEAEQKIFKTVGITLTNEMCRQTTGLDCIDTVRHWYNFKPWKGKKHEKIRDEIYTELKNLIKTKGRLKKDVEKTLRIISKNNIPLAIASASPMDIILAVLNTFKLDNEFNVVYSSESEKFGKPHPAVYISTARLLNVNPVNCMAFEDSFYGALAAKSARMKVVVILEKEDYDNPKFNFVDLRLGSFKEFDEDTLSYFNNLI